MEIKNKQHMNQEWKLSNSQLLNAESDPFTDGCYVLLKTLKKSSDLDLELKLF